MFGNMSEGRERESRAHFLEPTDPQYRNGLRFAVHYTREPRSLIPKRA